MIWIVWVPLAIAVMLILALVLFYTSGIIAYCRKWVYKKVRGIA